MEFNRVLRGDTALRELNHDPLTVRRVDRLPDQSGVARGGEAHDQQASDQALNALHVQIPFVGYPAQPLSTSRAIA